MDFSKLFKLGNKNNILENIKEVSLKGREDSEIRKTILDHFSSLFPYLELYNEGKQYTIPYGFRGKRKPDSLAFHEKEKRLYIFEYKSRIDEEMIVQTSNYRNALQNNKDNLHDLKDKWNEQVNKYRKLKDFKDNKARIICISPYFDGYAIGIEEEGEEEVHLIKITKYKNKEENLFLLQYKNDKLIAELSNNKDFSSFAPKNREKNLEYQQGWKREVKEWIERKIKPLEANFSLLSFEDKLGSGTDIKLREETIATVAWKSGLLNQPKLFLVDPSSLLKNKFKNKIFYDKINECYVYWVKSQQFFEEALLLLTEFIKEKS